MQGKSRYKVMLIFGTRPEAIKMAPVIMELRRRSDIFETVVAVTAQHREMLDQVLRLFSIVPDYDLNIMQEGQTLSQILARSVTGLEEPITREAPDLVLVHGDTSTTFGGALAAFYHKIPVGHVEAGLRSGDKRNPYPEEINRRLTGVITDLHFCPLITHKQNLLREGVGEELIFITGNTVIDALLWVVGRNYGACGQLPWAEKIRGTRMLLVTAHRRENLGAPLERICHAIRRVVEDYPDTSVVFPVHLNPCVQRTVFGILGGHERIHLTSPVDYETMVNLMREAYIVLTDSGGLQEEAPSLGKPVLVLREVTERPEGVEAGTLRLVGTDTERVYAEAVRLLEDRKAYSRMAEARNPYGDGRAAGRIVEAIAYYFGLSLEKPQDFGAN